MATKTKQWSDDSSATIQYGGQGDGQIIITSDPNEHYEARSMQITIETTNGSPKQTETITINQAAKQRIDLSAAVVTASNQTYSGSAKTPTPTVTLNGSTVPSSGYDVNYSNNTNAGTATITITGKGDYTGTATGTFIINKASRTLSFADSYMVLNTSSTGTKTATPSAGGGDGAITYSIANTTYATINSSTGAVTAKTSDGSVIVTASIAEGQNYLGATATYTLYVFATTHNYSYNGSYRSVTLPPGTYQFQVWGAQGGSNEANSTYGITAKAGGKGGYSVGQLTISQATEVRVYVGGQGSATAGGYNGGGSTQATSSKDSDNEFGYTKMGGGGGASDIRLSSGSLYSRMIVAGGGSGGAMCYKKVTTTVITGYNTTWSGHTNVSAWNKSTVSGGYQHRTTDYFGYSNAGKGLRLATYDFTSKIVDMGIKFMNGRTLVRSVSIPNGDWAYLPADGTWTAVQMYIIYSDDYHDSAVIYMEKGDPITEEQVSESNYSQVGYAGGGSSGIGQRAGTQSSAGVGGGDFGNGASQVVNAYRYVSGAGGGGWYGGGRGWDNSYIYIVGYSGGGSGFVNTAASAGNRPSGYTGLQLDSGTTYAGNTSFPAPGGGTETGHSGDGYVRITRLS